MAIAFKRPSISWLTAIAVSSLWMLALNWRGIGEFISCVSDDGQGRDHLYFLLPALLYLTLTLFSLLLSARWLLRPWLSLLLLVTGFSLYVREFLGILLNSDMLENFLETDTAEALTYINPVSVGVVTATGILPAALVWVPRMRFPQGLLRATALRAGLCCACLALLAALAFPFYNQLVITVRNHHYLRHQIIPYTAIFGAIKVAGDHLESLQEEPEHQRLAADVAPLPGAAQEEILILAVGETARAANFAQNGYGRNTTPYTSARGDVLFFTDVSSCGTSTRVSVPCMFSHRSRGEVDIDSARYEDNLTDFLTAAGYEVSWLENDSDCKYVCDRLRGVKSYSSDTVPTPGMCHGKDCLDEVLLPDLEGLISAPARRKVIVAHLKGSHGPTYFQRTTDAYRPFTPACATKELSRCGADEITNAYDNTLVYTDHILAEMIAMLERLAPGARLGLIYVSDHGESLGENGLFLHGTPYAIAPDFQKKVPMQVWLNGAMREGHGISRECLMGASRQGGYSHDHFFHSVLGLLGVGTPLYRRELDIFAPCRAQEGKG
ncbi:MAG: phosphoethanolamine transferase [Succinivibrionaceae bacterium]|nr:phosphoethanolamine transferase [Succinivibrionaceae bacterium]